MGEEKVTDRPGTMVRLPEHQRAWIQQKRYYEGVTQNALVIEAIEQMMKREARKKSK